MDPSMIRLLGLSLGESDDDWKSVQERHMFDILMAKYQYCPQYAWAISMTKDSVFKYRSVDPFWGTLRGQNKLGHLHSHIREVQANLASHNVNWVNAYKLRHHNLHVCGPEYWT